MDLTSAVRTDTLPGIATLIIPGAFASGTWIAFGLLEMPGVAEYLMEREALSIVVLILSWIAFGFIVESTGSYIEAYVIDRWRPDRVELAKIWAKYLALSWEHEPVGQRYLRRLLITFKFELNMLTATLFSIIGVVALWARDILHCEAASWTLLGLASFAALLFFWSYQSSVVLAKVRKILTNRRR